MHKEYPKYTPEAKSGHADDGLDRLAKLYSIEKRFLTSVAIGAPTLLFSASLIGDPMQIPVFGVALTGYGSTVLELGKFAYQLTKTIKNERLTIIDPHYNFKSDNYNYREKLVIRWGAHELSPQDNIHYLYLPRLNKLDNAKSLPGRLVHEYTQSILPALICSAENNELKYVAIDSMVPLFFSQGAKVSRKQLLQRNGLQIRNPQQKVRIMTTQELKKESVSQEANEFDLGINYLNDSWLNEYRQRVYHLGSYEELVNLTELINSRIKKILRQELIMLYGESGIVRAGRIHDRKKKRVYWDVMLEEKASGLTMLKKTNFGDTSRISLNKLFSSKLTEDISDIIQENNSQTKAQVCHELYRLLRSNILEKILEAKNIRPHREIVREIESYGYEFVAPSESLLTYVELFPLKKKFLPKAAAAILGASIFTGFGVAEYNKMQSKTLNSDSINQGVAEEFFSVSFLEQLPESGLVWHVQSTIPSGGLYITATSHELSGGTWIIDRGDYTVSKYPQFDFTELQDDFVILSRGVPLTEGNSMVDLPQRTDLKLQAINVIDENNQLIDAEILEYEDGTKRLHVLGDLWSLPPSAIVQALFVPNESAAITATESLEPLRLDLLDTDTIKTLQNLYLQNRETLNPQSIASFLANTKEYQLGLPVGATIDYSTRESILNSLLDIQGCTCEICATQAVLLASVFPQIEVPVNIAFGYLLENYSNTSISNSYLRNETFHALAIDGAGVLYDATPGKVSGDDLTQAYLRMLGVPVFSGIDGLAWENQLKQLQDEAMKARQLEIMSKVLQSSAAFGVIGITGWYVGKNRKKFMAKGKFLDASDMLFSKLISSQDLTDSFQFLSWVSWGTTDFPAVINRAENEGITFAEMSSKLDYDKIMDYHNNPNAFGGNLTTKMLASYLLFRNKFK